MAFLPLPNPPGVLLVPKILFVSGLFQPGLLAGSFPGLLTSGLETETLTLPMPVIRKKMFLAVEALAAAILSLHWFLNQRNQSEETSEAKGKKIHREEKSEQPRRKKNLSQSGQENSGEENPFLNRPFCGISITPLAVWWPFGFG